MIVQIQDSETTEPRRYRSMPETLIGKQPDCDVVLSGGNLAPSRTHRGRRRRHADRDRRAPTARS
jgi:hypothetical protein